MDHIFIILPGRLVTRRVKFGRTQGKCRGERLVTVVGGKAHAIRTVLGLFADTGYGASLGVYFRCRSVVRSLGCNK